MKHMVSSVVSRDKENATFFDDDQTAAERILLELADYIYGHTSLKPMSKTLFLVSRCLLVATEGERAVDVGTVLSNYQRARQLLGDAAPEDDYSLESVLEECADHLELIMSRLVEVRRLTLGTDTLGLAFNALLRGKIEGGEGLGTFLTPEEVVQPMVEMAFATFKGRTLEERLSNGDLFGDICGGTGRFVFAASRELLSRGFPKSKIEKAARLYDQSRLAISLARINFALQDQRPHFRSVSDSLVDKEIASERERYCLLATNPPFGSAKYRLHSSNLAWLPTPLLRFIADTGRGGSVDPAILFLVRNLDLLAPDGVLAIVLPDGIARTRVLTELLVQYERIRHCGVDLAATVSLPSVTFALGGTVAKTSFVVLHKATSPRTVPTFTAVVRHVGFLKRGNRRVNDPRGNDLIRVAAEYASGEWEIDGGAYNWRTAGAASSINDLLSRTSERGSDLVGDLATPIRARAREAAEGARAFHVSVLDVDATGLIDVIAARANKPVSRGLACQPGDVLVSCINPRHWRVAVVPAIHGDWSCSPEFLVLRPRGHAPQAGWALAIRLHHRSVIDAASQAASGTSSSRQRIEKSLLLDLSLPPIAIDEAQLEDHQRSRIDLYERRLREAEAYERLHEGVARFDLNS